jgi:hypothetical protein
MEKFETHAGPKTLDDVLDELVPGRRDPAVVAARRLPLDPVAAVPAATVSAEVSTTAKVGLTDWESVRAESFFNTAPVTVPTGPVGPTGPLPVPPGANGPAGPLGVVVPTGPDSSPAQFERDRAEVDLRQAIRRCFKEGVPLDRMVEIFRLELVDVVHDD